MKPIVYVDIDGTILQLNESIRKYLESKGIHFHPELQTSYDYTGNIGCNKNDIYACFSKLEIYKNAPLYYKAKEAIHILNKYADVYAWSHITPLPELKEERLKLCKQLSIKPLLFEFPKEDKKITDNVAAVFDDSPKNLEKWFNTNTDLYLIRQPYNDNYHNRRIMKVYNLAEGVDKFINRLSR